MQLKGDSSYFGRHGQTSAKRTKSGPSFQL